MPSPTFHRLSPKKRSRFVHEAYKEFSLNTYQGASITNLVKTLGIAKGSVYQYFEDKDELYRFLVEELMQQMNTLLDKTCRYEGEEFYTWYNKLLIVQVRYFLSFPSHAILLRQAMTGILGIDRSLKKEVQRSLHSRLKLALSQEMAKDDIIMQQLIYAPLLLFDLLTSNLNLAKIISADDPIYLDPDELMAACADWTSKLKTGL